MIERARHRLHRSGRYLGVNGGGIDLGVAQQHLDHADIDALFEQVSGKRMAQSVRTHALMDPGELGRLMHGAVQLSRRDRIGAAAAWEQPAIGEHHPAALAFAPPLTKQIQQVRGKHGALGPCVPCPARHG